MVNTLLVKSPSSIGFLFRNGEGGCLFILHWFIRCTLIDNKASWPWKAHLETTYKWSVGHFQFPMKDKCKGSWFHFYFCPLYLVVVFVFLQKLNETVCESTLKTVTLSTSVRLILLSLQLIIDKYQVTVIYLWLLRENTLDQQDSI